MNIADSVYTDLYNIIVVQVIPKGINAIAILSEGGYFRNIAILAIALIAMGLIYGKLDATQAFKGGLSVILVMAFFSNGFGGLYLQQIMVSVFVDGAIEMGGVISTALASTAGTIDGVAVGSLVPDGSGGRTAFGGLWDASTGLANKIWESAGWSDFGTYFTGLLVYVIAILLLVVQILVLATALIMIAIAILLAPLFVPMILFNSTRQMFQSWVGFGLAGSFALTILLVMMGVIMAFMTLSFKQTFNIDIGAVITDYGDFADFEKIAALLLFMGISVKLMPNVTSWASSLAGASAEGITSGLSAVGNVVQGALKANKERRKRNKENPEYKSLASKGGEVARKLGRGVTKGLSSIKTAVSNEVSGKATQKRKQGQVKSKIKERMKNREGKKGNPTEKLKGAENRLNKLKKLGNSGKQDNLKKTDRSGTPANASKFKALAKKESDVGNARKSKTPQAKTDVKRSSKLPQNTTSKSKSSNGLKSNKSKVRSNISQSAQVKLSEESQNKSSNDSKVNSPKPKNNGNSVSQSPQSSNNSVDRDKTLQSKQKREKAGGELKNSSTPNPIITSNDKNVKRDSSLTNKQNREKAKSNDDKDKHRKQIELQNREIRRKQVDHFADKKKEEDEGKS